MLADSTLPEELYQEFLRVRQKQKLAGVPTVEMTEICRRMTPQQRCLIAGRMSREARHEILQNVRNDFPAWPEEFVRAEASLRFLALCG